MRTPQTTAAAFVLLVVAFAGVSSSHAADWPEHHGPGRTNISPDTGLLKRWPEGGPRKLWIYSQCGRGYSGVTIADGMIFTAGDFDRR